MEVSKIAQFDFKYSTYAPTALNIRNKITADELEPHVAREDDSENQQETAYSATSNKNELF